MIKRMQCTNILYISVQYNNTNCSVKNVLENDEATLSEKVKKSEIVETCQCLSKTLIDPLTSVNTFSLHNSLVKNPRFHRLQLLSTSFHLKLFLCSL